MCWGGPNPFLTTHLQPAPHGQITCLLQEVREGDRVAAGALLDMAYAELAGLARMCLAGERHNHTLQPTALVHEAWLKIAGGFGQASDRNHFFAIASQAMRRVLTDHARGRLRQKRGGRKQNLTLDTSYGAAHDNNLDCLELEDTLTRLEQLNERHARVVEMRVLGGLTIAECAEALGVSHTTVEKDWFMARAWLRKHMQHSD